MSDIPLRDLRNLRADAGISLSAPANMTSRSLAPPPTKRNRLYKSGRKHDQYADDSEEEQGLLGSHSFEDGGEFQQGSSTSPVSRDAGHRLHALTLRRLLLMSLHRRQKTSHEWRRLVSSRSFLTLGSDRLCTFRLQRGADRRRRILPHFSHDIFRVNLQSQITNNRD